jgi:hypothetical protein
MKMGVFWNVATHNLLDTVWSFRAACEPGSSVSIVTGYRLGDRVQSLTQADDFSSNLCVQTGSGAHPASYTMTTGGSFPGGKARPGRDADHSPTSSAELKKE